MNPPYPPCDRCYDRQIAVEALLTQLIDYAADLPSWDEFVRMDPGAHASALGAAAHVRWAAEEIVDDLESLNACCASHWAPVLAAALQLRTAARIRDRGGMDLSVSLRSPIEKAATSLKTNLKAAKALHAVPY